MIPGQLEHLAAPGIGKGSQRSFAVKARHGRHLNCILRQYVTLVPGNVASPSGIPNGPWAASQAGRRRQQPGAREAARGWLGDTAALEPVTRAELRRRMREGGVLVLDVRPAAEYAAGHVAGAVSIPVGELAARLAGLPRDKEIIASCRGRFCAMSLDAVRLLRRQGYCARPMDGGLPEWRDEGMPTAAA